MLVKILSRSNYGAFNGLINYILRDDAAKEGEQPLIFTKNLRGQDPVEWIEQYKSNESWRNGRIRKDNVLLYHCILSASKNPDNWNTTPEELEKLFNKFTELWGKETYHASQVHYDGSVVHLHIATSGLELMTGKSMRLSHAELHNMKMELQRFQQQHSIFPDSLVDHGKGKDYISDKEYHAKKSERTFTKDKLREILNELYSQSKTSHEFLDLIQKSNESLQYYERNGVPTGILYENKKYRFSKILDQPFSELHPDPELSVQETQTLNEIQSLRKQRNERTMSLDFGRDSIQK